jgi:hypothetical protein
LCFYCYIKSNVFRINFQFQTPFTPRSMQQQSEVNSSLNTLRNAAPSQSLSLPNVNQQKNNIVVTHNYPDNRLIHILRTQSNWTTTYKYNILSLRFYPKIPKTTRRTVKDGPIYTIPNNYLVQLHVYNTEVICSTQYQFNGDVKFIVTWDKPNGKKESVYSLKSASDVGHLFLKVITIFRNIKNNIN